MAKHVFADRINEAHELYELSKGTQYEETCWNYYEATMKLARIAGGLQRRAFAQSMPSVEVAVACAR